MIHYENYRIYSDDKFVKRKSDGLVAKRIAAMIYNSDDYEEVDTIPNNEEYKNKVNELVRQRYSISDELAILKQQNITKEEYEEYDMFVRACEEKAKQYF